MSAATARRCLGGNVTRYDALTGSRIDSVDVVPCSVAAGDGVAYAAGCPNVQPPQHGRGQAATGAPTAIPLPAPPTAENVRTTLFGLAMGEGAVWAIGDALDRRLFKIAPRSGRLLATSRCRSLRSGSPSGRERSGSPTPSMTCWSRSIPRAAGSCGASRPAVAPTASPSAPGASGSRPARRAGRAHRSGERPDRRAHRRRPGSARDRGWAERRLGDARCDLAAAGSRWACVALALAGRCAAGAANRRRRPFRIGVLADCTGIVAETYDWSLAAAELPLLQHGGRLAGKGPGGGVQRREGRRARRSRSSRAAPRRASSAA